MGVTRLSTFLWDTDGPINYDRNVEKWPRTQTLRPLYEVNSAIFIASTEIYGRDADRIGRSPLLYEISKDKTVDIDWPDDFEIAERLWQTRRSV
jgi:CMP-N-acetylneuraminic acid synthetase